jgi:AraC family transcriptional regulator
MRNAGYRKPFLNVPTFVTSASCGAQIAFSRVQLNWAGRTLDDNPTEDAYSFFINFLQQASYSVSWRGHTTERYWFDVGNSALLDYKQVLKTTLHSPVDAVRLYVPRLTLQDFVREEYGYREVHLKPPQRVMRDLILYHLGSCLSALFEHPEESNSLLVDHIALSLQSHLYQTYATIPALNSRKRGGLAPWQESRAKEAVAANLDKEITMAQLAHDCGLSPSQFARAFKQSTGCPPHRWLLQRRVARAQELLLTSDNTLAEIASSCGFFDPSHLTRAFAQTVGTSPGLWRRARRS